MSDIIKIYSDGACKGNPGAGGWGALLIAGAHRKEIFGGEPDTTNNRMEIMAVIQALVLLKRPSIVAVYADSQYVLKGISEWMPDWKRRGWHSSSGKPVKNQDLWERLDAASQPHRIEWNWVRGHAGHPENERADYLANLGVGRAG